MIREQPPTALISSGERRIINPHVPGTVYHQNFNTLVDFYWHHSQDALEKRFEEFRQMGENFLAYSVQQMSDFDFRAGVIRDVLLQRFNKDVNSTSAAA